jgi:hypothetical protein
LAVTEPALGSRHVALPVVAGEHLSRFVELLPSDIRVRCDGAQQRLVAGDIIEHAGEEVRRARRRANVAGADAGERQEAFEMSGSPAR